MVALRLTKVVVPAYELYGGSALLECQYELNNGDNNDPNAKPANKHHYAFDSNEQADDHGEKLYSVKWYKDNEEFYRYVPQSTPPQHSYKVEGVRVDVSIKKSPAS